MIKCSCGVKLVTNKEWLQHFMLGRPSVPIKSRLTKIPDEKIMEARRRREEYDKSHVAERGEK